MIRFEWLKSWAISNVLDGGQDSVWEVVRSMRCSCCGSDESCVDSDLAGAFTPRGREQRVKSSSTRPKGRRLQGDIESTGA